MTVPRNKPRTYTKKRRAAQEAETRRRIVEATVELHGSVGPAFTSLSMVAERAGVQRKTLYAHFPDEWSLFQACSAHTLTQDPLPSPDTWRPIADPYERLRVGLQSIYGWYARNADLTACVMRDAESHALTREVVKLRMGPILAAYRDVLGTDFDRPHRAMLALALSFFTWRTLVRDGGLSPDAAVAAMVDAVRGAARPCTR